ncbi:DUF2851 family protein [Marivirga arenosa]|uniref:DUF2851 family protein n=1 Tax=Marivirga arenosa TaxID=3059076 RepID=A0AA51N9Q3_9BACT|nr:DUF2851 family protein [Marivirga sp. ABR2-2]WMN07095.1 DUF2851 family protein [Marivirga sp. ABR2-2]
MKEDFLHYVWRYQKFDNKNLLTTQKLSLKIIKTGFPHTDSGPDFKQAKIRIDDIEWNGAVEIHIKSSDWNRHEHQHDESYQNVVLHVVWQNDLAIHHPDGSLIPTLELKDRIDIDLIEKYNQLQKSKDHIPCASQWPKVDSILKSQMFEKALVERLLNKSEKAKSMFENEVQDWEQASYFMLLSAFGFKVNQYPFERLAELLPYQIIKKYRSSVFQLEALLFGAAGFLEFDFRDEYPNQLKNEWHFLRHKHAEVFQKELKFLEWKFLRLRPANFPTIRIAQLAQIFHLFDSLFEAFVIETNAKILLKRLKVGVSDYWMNHYQFDKLSTSKNKQLGANSIKIVVINTIPPLLASYANSIVEEKYMDKALSILKELKPENNYITKKFTVINTEFNSAFDSQAAIQLHNEYCQPKRCLDCTIGLSLLKA